MRMTGRVKLIYFSLFQFQRNDNYEIYVRSMITARNTSVLNDDGNAAIQFKVYKLCPY